MVLAALYWMILAPAPTREAGGGGGGKNLTYQDIQAQMVGWRKRYPRLVHQSVLGKTVEGHPILMVRLSDDAAPKVSEPGILLVGGMHPREQQPPVCLLALGEELLAGYGTDKRATHLLKDRQIYIVPMLNVDGKLYDQSDPQGPYGKDWRKNRSKNADGTTGIDLNRNFPVRWGGFRETDTLWQDRTTNPRGNIYEGLMSLSAPETRALADFLANHTNDIRLFVDLHSPLRKVLFPNYLFGADADRYQKLADGVRERQTDHPYPATEIKRDSEPKPGIRTGNTGLSYTYSYYMQGIYGFNIEIGLEAKAGGEEAATGDLSPRHYPPLENIRAEYQNNIREPLYFLLEAAGDLPAPTKGTALVMESKTDLPVTPGVTIAWTPTLSGTATYAVLTSERPEIVVESELRRVPVTTGFTLKVAEDAKPGTLVPLTLTIWDSDRHISRSRVVLTIAAPSDTILLEDKK